jgi:23S rRNA G2445 N2-methylase RlmL
VTARRSSDFDLDAAMAAPGFTPRLGDVPALVGRVAQGGDAAELAEKALLRIGLAAGTEAASQAERAAPELRARLTRFAGRMAASKGGEVLAPFLIARLGDDDERTRRAAATALGKTRTPGADEALAAALGREGDTPARRAMIEALGKVGGASALAALAQAAQAAPQESAAGSLETKARLMATRSVARAEASQVELDRTAPGPLLVALRCRGGLEELMEGEIDPSWKPVRRHDPLGGTRVEATLSGPLAGVFRSRLMLSFGFPLPPERMRSEDDLPSAIARALGSQAAVDLLRHFTRGPLRYRLAWASGGKRRASIWRAAAEIAALRPELINDPTDSPWEATVAEAHGSVRVELTPRVDDPRFAYRKGDVPAASHPTIAAALVRVAGVRAGDVVWDPFVGSGLELCERALAGSFRMMIGSDKDPAALAVARINLASAGVSEESLRLLPGDATTMVPPARPSLIITNPPLGRRVMRSAALSPLLDRFMANAAKNLAPGGRLVWIAPFPADSDAVARRAGLEHYAGLDVDMGGFSARLQALRKSG